ncbi:sulfite exporter TauE/SafE family protein 3-like isoform X2 [Elaeis guineensis]
MCGRWRGRLRTSVLTALGFFLALAVVSAERSLKIGGWIDDVSAEEEMFAFSYLLNLMDFLWQADGSYYHHVSPPNEFGWRPVIGSMIGFLGAAFGSVGNIGGDGIFVPMLTLIIGFDSKSSTALSKCMIMGAAGSTVYCNLKLR